MLEFHKGTVSGGTTGTVVNYGDIAGEMFSYVIISAPSRPLMVNAGTAPTENYTTYSVQLSYYTNAIIYPKNDSVSRALGVHLTRDEGYAHHRRQNANKSTHMLHGMLGKENGFFEKAWD